ncbi:MAG: radical SAM protein [Candidatus Omnitrophica bacterium]|nr:radical SAM protein [Candidatus Omnitrophota bacterium]
MDYSFQGVSKWLKISFTRQKLPPFLIFFVTHKCNLLCEHCFYWKQIEERRTSDLNIGEIEKLSKQLGRLYNLLISGGEPFLRDDLETICDIFYRNNNTSKIIIPTNGFMPEKIHKITKDILERCPGMTLELNLSLDGMQGVHDKLRGIKGSFQNALKTYKLLTSLKDQYKNFKLYIATTISNVNIKELPVFENFVKNNMQTIDGHLFAFFRDSGRDENIFFPQDEYRKLLSDSVTNKHIGIDRLLIKAKMATLRDKKQLIKCLAGGIIGVIDYNGDVRLCELSKPIGNIREDDFPSIWYSEAAQTERKKIKEGKCYCSHECFIAPSTLYSCSNLFRSIIIYLRERH